MTACAEGIESGASLDVLGDLRCDRAQGFLIGRPLPADELKGLIQGLGGRRVVWSAPPERQMAFPDFGFERAGHGTAESPALCGTCA
jgi:hypothetical protein